MLVENEKIKSTLKFRSNFVERALEDGHRMMTLETKKNAETIEYIPLDKLPAIMAAIPEKSRKWKEWDASEAVKLTSLIHEYWNLNPEKTRPNIHKSTPLNVKHNELLIQFFEDKQSKQAIDKYKSLWCRFLSRERLNDMAKNDFRYKKTHGAYEQLNHEKHLDLLNALDFVFTEQATITKGDHKGKIACYEPVKPADTQKSIDEIDKIVPRVGLLGRPDLSLWFRKTGSLLKWFGDNNVEHCMHRELVTSRSNSDRKEQAWIIDTALALENASMMRVSNINDETRSHTFDSLRADVDSLRADVLYSFNNL